MPKLGSAKTGQRPQKSVTLDFTKMRGHAADANLSGYGELPEGYYYAPNIWQIRTDGVLTTRTTFTKDADDTPTYNPISCFNGGGAYASIPTAMLMVASSDGTNTAFQRYSNASDTAFTWSSAGSAAALDINKYQPSWARVGNHVVFCYDNNSPVSLVLASDTAIYTTGTALTTLASGMCCTHLNRICIVGSSERYKIFYSDAGNSEAGYSGSAAVGGAEENIRGLFELNGSLVVLKTKSIWMKGAYSQIVDTEFLPVATGIPEPIQNAFVVAQNVLYYMNRGGMYAWAGGGSPVNISEPIWSYFQQNNLGNMEKVRIGYWQALNKIWFKVGSSNVVHLYDINRKKWEQMSDLAWIASANVDGKFYALKLATKEYREWNDFTLIAGGANETSLASYVNTGWLDFGSMNFKIVKSIVFDGSGIDQVAPRGVNSLSTASTTITTITPIGNKAIFTPNVLFRKWMFIFQSSTSAPIYLRSCTITFEEVEEI